MIFKNRDIIEMNFVFCLWKQPKIYNKFVKKIGEQQNFLESEIAKFFFVIGKKMVDSGITSFDNATILAYLSGNSLIKDKFEEYDGYNTFELISKSLDSANADGYFSEILKMNVINELEQKGFNVEKDYPQLSQMSTEEIRAFYSYKLNDAFLKTGGETRVEDFEITEDDFELFNSGSEMGLSIASTSPLLNYEILGLNRGLSFVGGHVNQGKSQPQYSKVMTNKGWVEIGRLKINQEVYGYSFQNKCWERSKVIGIYPQGKRDVYRMVLSDGSWADSDLEHLWTIRVEGIIQTLTTREIIELQQNKLANDIFMLPRLPIDVCKVTARRDVYHKSLPYDYWALGYLLSDMVDLDTQTIEFTDRKHFVKFCKAFGYNEDSITEFTEDTFYRVCKLTLPIDLMKWLKGETPLTAFQLKRKKDKLTNKIYKYIPEDMIIYTSKEKREAFLAGWVNGSSYSDTNVETRWYCKTKNVPMIMSMQRLAWSLGYGAVMSEDERNLTITFSGTEPLKIDGIYKLENQEDMICIEIDHPTHLYMTENYIPTHNTSFSLAVIIKAWLNQKIKCCIISNEQTIQEFKQLLMAMVSYELYGENSLNRRRLKMGHFSTEEEDMFKKIAKKINEEYVPYIKFAKIFNYSIEDVQMIIETLSAQGFGGFIYDVFKADDSASHKVIGEMKEMAKELFMVADRTDSSIVATVQLGLSDMGVRFLTLENISTSKHITEPATEVMLIRGMWEDEVTGGKNDIHIESPTFDSHGNPMKDKNGKPIMKQITITGNEYKQVKLVFLAKTRNTSQGIVIAYRFDGQHNQWKELGYCYPSFENRTKR